MAGRGGDVKRIYLDRTRPGTHMHTKITPRRILLGGVDSRLPPRKRQQREKNDDLVSEIKDRMRDRYCLFYCP